MIKPYLKIDKCKSKRLVLIRRFLCEKWLAQVVIIVVGLYFGMVPQVHAAQETWQQIYKTKGLMLFIDNSLVFEKKREQCWFGQKMSRHKRSSIPNI